ncbi:MAG: SRPBCC family protein [Marinirhabdus sp.]
MKLNSKETTVPKPAGQVCAFLGKAPNYGQLMPENTSKFEVLNEKAFVFALKGMPEIALEIKENNCPNNIVLGAMGGKFPFTLTANLTTVSTNETTVILNFEGNFNPMMAMMVKSPISKFIETLAEKLQHA